MTHPLRRILDHQESGAVGVYSICSAHPYVLRAAIAQATADESYLLVESTSNQVDQFGGYTGMTPGEFRSYVEQLTDHASFPRERLILGGDHLGPNRWTGEPATSAMEKARELIRSYVRAGYRKIHLDTSMRCLDDPGDETTPLAEETIAERAAELCRVAEETVGDGVQPVYIVGTEVPPPGGARSGDHEIDVTPADAVRETIETTRKSFLARELTSGWERVIGVVVQPGVEFGDDFVIPYRREAARALKEVIEEYPGLSFEAHSTDYQSPSHLRALVEDHFAILKVGPALTFAFREAVFALAAIEKEFLPPGERSHLPSVLDRVMLEDPQHWQDHYRGTGEELRRARKYSFSDRCRYYWPREEVQAALQRLLENLEGRDLPPNLLSQFLPAQARAVLDGIIEPRPEDLILHKIREVTRAYARACGS